MKSLEFVSTKHDEGIEVGEPLSICAQASAARFCGVAVRQVNFRNPAPSACVLVKPAYTTDQKKLARILRFVTVVGIAAEGSVHGVGSPEALIEFAADRNIELSTADASRAFEFFKLNHDEILEWAQKLLKRTPQVLGFIYPAQPNLREFDGE